jgi:alpha-N-arabinofuranosidase
MELYNVHQDATMLPVKLISNDYVLGAEKLPAVSVSASRDKNGVIHISLANIDAAKSQDISLDINGAKLKSVSGRIITSKKLQDYNSFDEPGKIQPKEFKDASISANGLRVKLPPFSVVVLTLK